MSARTPKALLLIAILALAGAALIAGCGGSGGKTVTGQTPPANETPETESGSQSETEAGPEEGTSEEGGMEEEGGQSEGTESGGAMEEESGTSEGTEGGESEGGATAMADGSEVFASNCASCHTLAAAGAQGTIGPNLDELMPSEATVEMQVVNGGGAMPAFGKEEILAPNEVEAVSAYVSSEAGK